MTDNQAKRITRNLLIKHYARMHHLQDEVVSLYRIMDGDVWFWNSHALRWAKLREGLDRWKKRMATYRAKLVRISCDKAYAIQRKRVLRLQEKLEQWLRENP
jgi:hypothetical protein